MDKFDWHERFSSQLFWTTELRDYIFKKIGNNGNQCVENLQNQSHQQAQQELLEIGCGTGALLTEIGRKYKFDLFMPLKWEETFNLCKNSARLSLIN